MALINCKNCGKPVSDQASACPNCGEPLNEINSVAQSFENETETTPGGYGNMPGSHNAPRPGGNNMVNALVAVAAVLLLAAAGAGVYYYQQRQKENEARLEAERQQAKLDSIAQAEKAAQKAIQDSIDAAESALKAKQDSIESAHQNIKSLYLEKVRAAARSGSESTWGDASESGYYLFDITRNGVPDLWTYIDGDLTIYTFSHGSLRQIFNNYSIPSHGGYSIGSNYFIFTFATQGLYQITKYYYSGGKMKEVVLNDHNPNYDDEDDDYEIPERSEPEIHFIPFSNESRILNMFH